MNRTIVSYFLVYLIAIEMSGEIHNRVEEVPFHFPEKKDEKPASNNGSEEKSGEEDTKKKFQVLSCDICKVKVTSAKIFQRHIDGRKHKLRAERQGKEFKCDLCDIIANSEIQLEIHYRSARHKVKLQRKENPHLAHFTYVTSKTTLLIVASFICILLNLFLLYKNYL